jgi:hypothetical protein
MNTKTLISFFIAALLAGGSALAADGKVTISSVMPKDPYPKDQITLTYEAMPGPNGDHLHLNVDGKRVDVIHQLKGSTTFGPLPSGKHHVCLAVNTASHVPTGVEGCVDITVW